LTLDTNKMRKIVMSEIGCYSNFTTY